MDRESLLAGCDKYAGDDLVKVEAVKIVINMIYDDLDSKICENCYHGGLNYVYGDCPIDDNMWTDGDLGKDFGCNKFERKL